MMFSQLRLTVPDITAVTQFYRDVLGMTDQRDGLGYEGQQVHLEFIQGSAQPPTADWFFGKLALLCPIWTRSPCTCAEVACRSRNRVNLKTLAIWPIAWIRQGPRLRCYSRVQRAVSPP